MCIAHVCCYLINKYPGLFKSSFHQSKAHDSYLIMLELADRDQCIVYLSQWQSLADSVFDQRPIMINPSKSNDLDIWKQMPNNPRSGHRLS